MACRLRPATADDFYQFFGRSPPAYWTGIVGDAGWMLTGIGGLVLGVDGRWWVTLQRAPGVRSVKRVLQAARVLREAVAEAGMTVYAIRDRDIAGSADLLQRLGFVLTAERWKDQEVWQWAPRP
jgi:hypothetical protein